jgi:hypothetical protein
MATKEANALNLILDGSSENNGNSADAAGISLDFSAAYNLSDNNDDKLDFSSPYIAASDNNDNDNDNNKQEHVETEEEVSARSAKSKEDCLVLFRSALGFMILLTVSVLISVFAWAPGAWYDLRIKDCDMSVYNQVQNNAAAGKTASVWPVATADYYKSWQPTLNITANSDWYVNQSPCLGWQFDSVSGICPLALATVKVQATSNSDSWSGTYEEFLAQNPENLAPKCNSDGDLDRRRRYLREYEYEYEYESENDHRTLKTKSSTSTNTKKKRGPTYTVEYVHCIAYDGKGEDVFKTITATNKVNGFDKDNNVSNGNDDFKSTKNFAMVSAIVCWFFFIPLGLAYLILIVKSDKVMGWMIFASIAKLIIAILSTILLNKYNSSSWLQTSGANDWSPMFPSCTVTISKSDTPLPKIALTSVIMSWILVFLQIFNYRSGQHEKAKSLESLVDMY